MRNAARREAGLRAYFRTQMKADYIAFRGLLHHRGLRRLGHLGPRRQAAADRADAAS